MVFLCLVTMSVLTLLDLPATFDTIGHSILCDFLSPNFGTGGNVLGRLRSFLSDRSQDVMISGNSPDFRLLKYGVYQGSVVSPVLCTLYTMPLGLLT